MAIINKINNTASIEYGGKTINSLPVETLLLLAPTIVKIVDKPVAAIGETLTYTITITNIAIGSLTNLPFTDTIPAGSNYVTDSFKVNNTTVTPTITAGILSYTIPSIAGMGTAIITFQVKIVG